MQNFQRKIGWGGIVESWPVLVILSMGLLFFAWGVWGMLGKMEVTRENKKLAEEKVVELEQKKSKLSYDIDQLKTIEGEEASIREKFGLAKDGEGLIMIIDEKPVSQSTPQSSGIFSFLKNLFK